MVLGRSHNKRTLQHSFSELAHEINLRPEQDEAFSVWLACMIMPNKNSSVIIDTDGISLRSFVFGVTIEEPIFKMIKIWPLVIVHCS